MANEAFYSVDVILNAGDMYRYSMTALLRRFKWITVMYTGLAVYLAFQFSRPSFHWTWSAGNVFAPLFFFVFFPYAFFVAPYFSSKKYLERNPNLVGPNTYTFSTNGVDILGRQTKSHLDWGAIQDVRETSAQLLLYTQTAIAHVIPKRAFSSIQQLVEVRDLLRRNVKTARLRRK